MGFVYENISFIVVYYESIKRELKRILIRECRCDERLRAKAEGSTRLAYTGCSVLFPGEKRRKPKVKIVTLQLCGVRKSR